MSDIICISYSCPAPWCAPAPSGAVSHPAILYHSFNKHFISWNHLFHADLFHLIETEHIALFQMIIRFMSGLQSDFLFDISNIVNTGRYHWLKCRRFSPSQTAKSELRLKIHTHNSILFLQVLCKCRQYCHFSILSSSVNGKIFLIIYHGFDPFQTIGLLPFREIIL